MNTTSNVKNQASNSSGDNVFLPNISSDNNANPSDGNNLKDACDIPKSKIDSVNIPNGVTSSLHAKLNNNIHDAQLETHGPRQGNKFDENVDQCQEKHCYKINNSTNGFGTFTNGYKAVVNGDDKDVSKMVREENPTCEITVNSSAGNCSEPKDQCKSEFKNTFSLYTDPGPSTSSSYNNIHSNFAVKNSDSDCSSETGNDEISCSDECCIYTYKGDVADLPQSFMNLDIQDNNDGHDHSKAGSRGSSPEMDFLEMDFDPGPSCDADSDESSAVIDLQSDSLPMDRAPTPVVPELTNNSPKNIPDDVDVVENAVVENNLSSQSPALPGPSTPSESQNVNHIENNTVDESVNEVMDTPWIPKLAAHRTFRSNIIRESKGHHSSSGDLISPSENNVPSTSSSSMECRINTSSFLYHSTMEKQLVLEKQSANAEIVPSVERTMIWTEQEAGVKQVTQIGTSACGATAVLNVLAALGHEIPCNETVMKSVHTNLRANTSPLVQYLLSRSNAGSTHTDLINGLHKLSNDKIYAKFFHMYPERYISLSQWLSYWIKKGAVPIATLNLQKGVWIENNIPDAWHHQMIFGVSPHGVFLTNPLERVEESVLWSQLSSESVLMIRREDVISRWTLQCFHELIDMSLKDVVWRKLNVVGQVANVIREHSRRMVSLSRTHVAIPAAYSAGITLAINRDNPAYELLKNSPDLPLVQEQL